MDTPSPGPSQEPQTRPPATMPTSVFKTNSNPPSPADPPLNARSPSGHHLTVPTPARRYSRDIPWTPGSQTSLHDEPSSINDPTVLPRGTLSLYPPGHLDRSSSWNNLTSNHMPMAESPLQTSSSVTIYTRRGDLTSYSDIHSRAAETPFGNTDVNSFPRSAHIHIDTNSNRSAPYSMRSASQLSVSQKSYTSRSSRRSSYREHRGPTARARTPVPEQVAPAFSYSSNSLERAEPGGSAAFGTMIAPPSANDPNKPGEPIPLGHRFYPMSVSGAIRYDNRKSKSSSGKNYKINGMSYQYPKTPDVPQGWTACRHPEGALYFVHDESKTFTEVYICDEDVHGDIEYFRTFLLSELEKEIKNQNLSDTLKVSEVELVLEPKLDELGVMCCYYFVNPPTRTIFWLDEWEGHEIFKDCKGELSLPHKGLAIEAQYWYARYVSYSCISNTTNLTAWNHWNLFPHSRKVTQDLKDEVVDMILHATCDHLTSNTSTCPISVEVLKNHLAIVDRIDPEKTGKREHCAVVIGRIMHEFYHAYFINYYGEECARLDFHQTVHGWRYRPSLFMTISAPLLFMAPVNKLQLLHGIFVDDTVNKETWNMFRTRLNSQFQAISVLATVLLNANVALPKASGSDNLPQQYLSYMSLVISMASIILGLVFMSNNRLEERIDPSEAASFLIGLRHEKHGLETLAIIYSLPYAFLMWGMVFFFAAFAAPWFYPGNTVLPACAGAFILIVATLVAWSIWTTRGPSDAWWFQPHSYQLRDSRSGGEQEDAASFGVPWMGYFHKLMTLFVRRRVTSQSSPGESRAMQQSGSFHSLGTRNSVSEPNLWASSHVT